MKKIMGLIEIYVDILADFCFLSNIKKDRFKLVF